MESMCSETFLSASAAETECYPNPKRVKIESNHRNIEKEEQQKLGQSTHCVNRYKTSPNEPIYLSERQNDWVLEKEICDRKRKNDMREFCHFQTWNNEKLQCRVLENKFSSKKWSSETEDKNTIKDGTSLNVHGQSSETELYNMWNVTQTGKHLNALNPSQMPQSNSTEQNNERDGGNELKHVSSVTALNRDLFQMEMLNHKSISDKKWRQYQLLQVPFLCGTSSIFSHLENEKNNFLKKVCTAEDKDCSSSDSETSTERDTKEKNNSSYIIPTLKPSKSIQPLEIPNFLMKENTFQFPHISNKLNNKIPSTDLKELEWKHFKSQPSLIQSEQKDCVQKISGIEEQLQSDENTVKASSMGSEFKEKGYQCISKQECTALAERAQVSVNYFRGNSTHTECSQIFVETDFKDKMLENSDGDDDHKSRVPIYISTKKFQNEKHINSTDILRRTVRNKSYENVTVFHIQKSIPMLSEALEKNNLNIYCGVHNSDSGICLHEAESKLATIEKFNFKRSLTKNITFESNCPHIVVQSFPDRKVSFTILRRKEMFKLKFSLQNMLFGRFRTWTESLHKDMPMYRDGGILRCFHFWEVLQEQYGTQELVKSSINKSHSNNVCLCLLAIISKHQNVKVLKTVFASFFNSKNTLPATEGKCMQVEKHPLRDREPIRLNLYIDSSLRQNIEFHEKYGTYSGIISPKLLENTCFELHNECQKTDFSRFLGREKKSSFLNKATLFCNQKSGLPSGRCVRKHRLLRRGSKEFLSTYSRSVSDKKDMKKQLIIVKCLVLTEGSFDCFSLEKTYDSNMRKMQHLTGANLRFFHYLHCSSQLKFEKLSSKYSNQQILLTALKQEKKPNKMFSSFLRGEQLKTFSFGLNENKKHKTPGRRNCIKSTHEVTYIMKECLGSSDCINPDRKEYLKSGDLQINSHNFLSKHSFSVFDIHKKIPITTDFEDLDQIPLVKQDNSVSEKYSEENTVTTSENVHNLPAKSSGVLILPEQSKKTMEKCNSLLLHDSQTNQPEYCKKMVGYSPHLANEKKNTDCLNSYLSSGNMFSSLLSGYQYATSPLDSSSSLNKDAVISEDGRCRSSLRAENKKQYEKMHATLQYPAAGSPTLTDTYLQRQAEETMVFSLHGHTQTPNAFSLEPATLKQNLEYVKEQGEINDEQMHVTNENQCEAVTNDLVMSYSEDESKTLIAVENKLKMHLSVMNNGCLEDVKDEYLPSESKTQYEFELKRKFDLVLEELRMFHEISKRNENDLSRVETNSHNSYCELNNSEGIDENVKNISQNKICISFPICDTIEMQNISANNQSSLKEKISSGNEEQKVYNEYCISRRPSEEVLHLPTAEGCFDSLYKKSYTWDPAFLSCTLMKEQSYNLQKEGGYFLSREVVRVQPLKTCRGPIRIGLSRRARPKQLHPYLK